MLLLKMIESRKRAILRLQAKIAEINGLVERTRSVGGKEVLQAAASQQQSRLATLQKEVADLEEVLASSSAQTAIPGTERPRAKGTL